MSGDLDQIAREWIAEIHHKGFIDLRDGREWPDGLLERIEQIDDFAADGGLMIFEWHGTGYLTPRGKGRSTRTSVPLRPDDLRSDRPEAVDG